MNTDTGKEVIEVMNKVIDELNKEENKDINMRIDVHIDENAAPFIEEYKYLVFAGHKDTPLKIFCYSNDMEDFKNKTSLMDSSDFTRFMMVFKQPDEEWKLSYIPRNISD